MGLHVKKLWPISALFKKDKTKTIEGGEPSKIRKGWKKIFHKSKKGDTSPGGNGSSNRQLVDEVAIPPVRVEVGAPGGSDEPLRRPSDNIEASHATEDVLLTAQGTESPPLLDDFEFRDWNEFVQFVVELIDNFEHDAGNHAQAPEQSLHGYQGLANPGIGYHSQHTREVSDTTLLNSIPAPSRTHLLPEEIPRTGISLIEEEERSQISVAFQPAVDRGAVANCLVTSPGGKGPSEAGDEAAVSETAKKNGTIAASRRSIESGNDNAAWEKVIEMIEKRHENDVADLKEEHELVVEERDKTIQRLTGQVKRVNKKNDRMQMRVNGLLEGHSALKTEVEATKEALQQVISASQVLRAQYDELKPKYESSIKGPMQDNSVRGESTTPIEQETEATTNESEIPMEDLDQLRDAFRNMASDLFRAHGENRNRWAKIYQLRRGLEQDPAPDTDL